MTDFKIGDVVRIVGGSSRKWKIDSFADGKARIVFRKKLEYGTQLIALKDIVLADPQADLKQAIREVLLSDEFMAKFAAAWMKTPIPMVRYEIIDANDPAPLRKAEPTQAQQLAERTIKPIWQTNDGGNQ